MATETIPTPRPNSIGESLEEFAACSGRPIGDAYRIWHEHGQQIAKAWQTPPTHTYEGGTSTRDQRTIHGGKVLGLWL